MVFASAPLLYSQTFLFLRQIPTTSVQPLAPFSSTMTASPPVLLSLGAAAVLHAASMEEMRCSGWGASGVAFKTLSVVVTDSPLVGASSAVINIRLPSHASGSDAVALTEAAAQLRCHPNVSFAFDEAASDFGLSRLNPLISPREAGMLALSLASNWVCYKFLFPSSASLGINMLVASLHVLLKRIRTAQSQFGGQESIGADFSADHADDEEGMLLLGGLDGGEGDDALAAQIKAFEGKLLLSTGFDLSFLWDHEGCQAK